MVPITGLKYQSNDKLNLFIDSYRSNDRPCIIAKTEIGTSHAVVTINLPDVDLGKYEVAIKNYAEGEGNLDALIKAKIVGQPIREVKTGYVTVPIVEVIHPELRKEIETLLP